MDGWWVGVIVCLWCLGFIRHSDGDVMVRLPWQSVLVLCFFYFFPLLRLGAATELGFCE